MITSPLPVKYEAQSFSVIQCNMPKLAIFFIAKNFDVPNFVCVKQQVNFCIISDKMIFFSFFLFFQHKLKSDKKKHVTIHKT